MNVLVSRAVLATETRPRLLVVDDLPDFTATVRELVRRAEGPHVEIVVENDALRAIA
ncbi:MAG: hypothetical protein ACYDCK_15220 [Thermoplasmatota archaeon]